MKINYMKILSNNRGGSGLIIVIIVGFIIAIAGGIYVARLENTQNQPSDDDSQDLPSLSESTSKLSISNQKSNKEIKFDSVELATNGFVVIYETDNGVPGDIIIASEIIESGVYEDYTMNLSLKFGSTYYAMLHEDNDKDGDFDKDTDSPIMNNVDKIVMAPFTVEEQLKNTLEVLDQDAASSILISSASLQETGFIVIHADEDDSPGAILGQSRALDEGNHSSISIPVPTEPATSYWAMLHGDNDDLDFNSSDDSPMKDSTGNIVVERFTTNEEVVDNDADTDSDDTDDTVIIDHDAGDAPLKTFTMTATQFDFSPSTITVDQGDMVRITATSIDVAHGISIPEFGVNVTLPINEPVTFEFVASQSGTFTFKCSVFCGSGHTEMTGTLIVNEK